MLVSGGLKLLAAARQCSEGAQSAGLCNVTAQMFQFLELVVFDFLALVLGSCNRPVRRLNPLGSWNRWSWHSDVLEPNDLQLESFQDVRIPD